MLIVHALNKTAKIESLFIMFPELFTINIRNELLEKVFVNIYIKIRHRHCSHEYRGGARFVPELKRVRSKGM